MSKHTKNYANNKWKKFTNKVKKQHNKDIKKTLKKMKKYKKLLIKEIQIVKNFDNKKKSLSNKIINKENNIHEVAFVLSKLRKSLQDINNKTCKKMKLYKKNNKTYKKSKTGGCGKNTMKNIIKKINKSLNLKWSDFKLSPKKLIKRYKKVRRMTRRRYKKRRNSSR